MTLREGAASNSAGTCDISACAKASTLLTNVLFCGKLFITFECSIICVSAGAALCPEKLKQYNISTKIVQSL